MITRFGTNRDDKKSLRDTDILASTPTSSCQMSSKAVLLHTEPLPIPIPKQHTQHGRTVSHESSRQFDR